ncbi:MULTISPECIES: hypothetical protein [Kitasatospora]|uniref:Uncharacterized protein n=1 Tax=Kitasatospora setae (strain ATCC 33774 / DSM 43861 / JCM 3304 / KCC A-0304 / NBRC 14216 / KM-6054) TaxID=452652 RepID=E4NF56_KITSK|nr:MULTISPECIES: hypothetical protein [Kitasatospora]BAJ30136.1 hypothetical protein KSE_43530 [Kitasatospora setae KM-6054]
MPLSDDQPHTRTRLPVAEQNAPAGGRPARPLRTLLTVLGIVTLLVVAVAVANRDKPAVDRTATTTSGDRAPAGAGASPDRTAASGQQPVGTAVNGIGTGYPHTDQGAQSAAANYAVALGSTDMFRADSRRTVLTTIADPTAVQTLQTRLDQAFTPETNARYGLSAEGRAPVGMTFISRAIPIGTKLANYSDTGTKVEVWCNSLVGMTGKASEIPVTASWYTLDITMRWTGSDWKIIDYSRKAGPAPLPADQQAATSEEISGAVQQFGGFRYAR